MAVLGRAIVRTLAMLLLVVIRARKALAIGVAALFLGWIALMNVNRLPIPGGALSQVAPVGASQSSSVGREVRAPARTGGAATGTSEPAVDSYINGLTQFDAKMMWGALSEEAITAMQSRGGSIDALQAGLDDAKRRGARYEDISMIGNYPLQDGRKYLFYVLSRRGFAGQDQLEQVYFVFTVNRDGKITRIE